MIQHSSFEKLLILYFKPLYLRHKGIPPLQLTVLILYTLFMPCHSIAMRYITETASRQNREIWEP